MTLVEENSTLKLVRSLLENDQDNIAIVTGIRKLSQNESDTTFVKEGLILQQQMQYLDSSIICLNKQDQEMISRLYKNEETHEKCARDMYLSKSQVFRKRAKLLQKIANYYEKLAK